MAYRRTPKVQARLDEQRAALLRAAQDVLADGGYAKCTVARVAERAGIATGSVYTHFGTKAELLADVFRVAVTREVAAVRDAARRAPTTTERVTAVIETFAARALKQPMRAYALLAEPVDPAVDALRLQFRTAYRDVIADALRAGVAAGELPPQDADVVAAALVGAVGEALVAPLAAARASDAAHEVDPTTVPTLLAFTHRAIGGPARAHA